MKNWIVSTWLYYLRRQRVSRTIPLTTCKKSSAQSSYFVRKCCLTPLPAFWERESSWRISLKLGLRLTFLLKRLSEHDRSSSHLPLHKSSKLSGLSLHSLACTCTSLFHK